MIKLLLYLLIIWAVVKCWKLLTAPAERPRTPPPVDGRRIDGGELVQDPQCGVYVPKATSLRGRGETHFCSEACRRAYEEKV
ncbi:MAG: hypothetical protein HY900_24110 [Deltaproteobacteria bacterium]|nr:hypothetical protein [Deltaproteobacteria bacterium]